jgi:tetratricopeptide (TPR) repeat protein
LNPRDAYSYLNRAIIYRRRGKAEQEFAELEKAIGVDSQCAPAYRDLGIFYMAHKSYELAKRAFQSALNLDPENAEYHRRLSEVLAVGR